MPDKLHQKDLKKYREWKLAQNDGKCELCHQPCVKPNLDHTHSGGWVRGTICARCNVALGRCENLARTGLKGADAIAFLRLAADYLDFHSINRTGLIHPLHRTASERTALAKKRALRKRKNNAE